jgi:hypothetical protein
MRLREVPDFRVVPYEREHGKIVDFMLDQVADLETIARQTGVPIETVIEFTNACDELLLIDRYFNDLATEDGYRIGRDNKFWQRLYSQIPGQSKRMSPGFWGAVLPRWAFRKR